MGLFFVMKRPEERRLGAPFIGKSRGPSSCCAYVGDLLFGGGGENTAPDLFPWVSWRNGAGPDVASLIKVES
jgi:hypothetical protein